MVVNFTNAAEFFMILSAIIASVLMLLYRGAFRKSGNFKVMGGLKKKYSVAFLPIALMLAIALSTDIVKATYYPVIADVVIIIFAVVGIVGLATLKMDDSKSDAAMARTFGLFRSTFIMYTFTFEIMILSMP
ncbi:hypothetical protein HAU32_09410 [Weissella confusa]|uniref:Uncharacterized protein n=1 Tax=Weissella fermenti TaxID=2987699 RepID=A0ABT6D6S4_9LACO|nr:MULTISPECIES: hypothetical protein [Weissella]MBJ7689181.1 hypothetical protein [Weissella confusa]MCW0925939.1 hypothetical protein [Weissella sp. LMG 11983]MDF9300796.1 hypothetical protein [Weissella sp. BK2]